MFERNVTLDKPDVNECWKQPTAIDEPRGYKQKNGKIIIAPYPYGFLPTLHRYRLIEPAKLKKPQNIFVCSMADLFGEWAPDEWIQEVFKACEAVPWHRYLFLTKNIHAYGDHDVPTGENFWYGQTWDCERTGLTGYHKRGIQTFLSIEPLLSGNLPIGALDDGWFDWVIVGAETGNRKGRVIPERKWINKIVDMCELTQTPVFMKNSLTSIWGEPLIQEFPW